jgi:hypothetical protein
MNIKDFATVLAAILRYDQALLDAGGAITDLIVPMLWGDPGVGKTETVESVANELGYGLVYTDLATRDPAELGGLPWIEDGRSIRCRPDWLPQEGRGILFLDELPQAGLAAMNIAATLIREHRIGEHALARGWLVVCAGNHPRNKAGTTAMPTHLRNRLLHLEVEADAELWARWAAGRRLDPVLVAYNRYRAAEYHHRFSTTDMAYPTPRSWVLGNRVQQLGLPAELEQACLRGAVGEAAAADYAGFRRLLARLPDPDGIIADPEAAALPQDPQTYYALMGALGSRATSRTFEAIIRYLDRLPEQEFSVVCVLDATARDRSLEQTAAYQRWAAAHGDLLTNR